jgi:hypothetical protein
MCYSRILPHIRPLSTHRDFLLNGGGMLSCSGPTHWERMRFYWLRILAFESRNCDLVRQGGNKSWDILYSFFGLSIGRTRGDQHGFMGRIRFRHLSYGLSGNSPRFQSYITSMIRRIRNRNRRLCGRSRPVARKSEKRLNCASFHRRPVWKNL